MNKGIKLITRASVAKQLGIIDKPGKPRFIHKSLLKVDTLYQRENIRQSKVAFFVKHWSWFACACLVVAKRIENGQPVYYVVDGQHRLLAAIRRKDITTLPCLVFECSSNSITAEAKAFVAINSNRSVAGTLDKYKAALQIGDPVAVQVNKIVTAAGYTVSIGKVGQKIKCIQALIEGLRIDPTGGLLADCLAVAAKVTDNGPIGDRLIGGLCFAERHLRKGKSGRSLSDGDVVAILEKSETQLNDTARNVFAYHSKDSRRLYGLGIIKYLNTKLGRKKLPEIPEAVALQKAGIGVA